VRLPGENTTLCRCPTFRTASYPLEMELQSLAAVSDCTSRELAGTIPSVIRRLPSAPSPA